jgi:Mg-chelatase subunit ChlD
MTTEETQNLHIYFLLDRSGSMESMASDVIGGFNAFLAAQSADGEDALMTLVQFDSENSHEVLANAAVLRNVSRLDAGTFLPRGGTPLYDAIGHLVADATIRSESKTSGGLLAEDILFVIFTDGQENQSVEYARQNIFDLISRKEESGWTFVFMGANQDVYAETDHIGIKAGNAQAYRADRMGSATAFDSVNKAVSNRRSKLRSHEYIDNTDFFEGEKDAEKDLNDRSGSK